MKKTVPHPWSQHSAKNENFPKTIAICAYPDLEFSFKGRKTQSQQGKPSRVCLCYLGGIDVNAVRRAVVGIIVLVGT